MQSAYIGKIMELAQRDNRVIHILADSGTGYDEMFRRNFPNQIYNFGISEENMVAAAAGMAAEGRIPFVYTAGAFLAYRSLEFIRDDICFQNLNVKVVGMGSGLAWSSLGPTHHTTEDVAMLRAIPGLMILSPATPRQTAECAEAAYRHQGPVYIKIGMNHEKEFYPSDYQMEVGKNEILREGGSISIFVTGSILEEADQAAERLEAEGIRVNLVNAVSVKPFDRANVLEMAARTRMFFTVEEHNVYGGLGSIIAEILAEEGLGVRLRRIGLQDCFAAGYGTHKSVRAENGLDAEGIYRKIKEYMGNE
ncbi:MAG: transketolase [Lachnospiraceae bacterium]|jgi:transketolase|nr:transketolase [Lachnospiraceae bacterium]